MGAKRPKSLVFKTLTIPTNRCKNFEIMKLEFVVSVQFLEPLEFQNKRN